MVERYPDKIEVGGSIPPTRTSVINFHIFAKANITFPLDNFFKKSIMNCSEKNRLFYYVICDEGAGAKVD